RHAKVATKPQHLYTIKKLTIDKLLQENKASKIGLHFSNNPKESNQHSTLLIKVSSYYFHIPPKKQDFNLLKHLANSDDEYRSCQSLITLSQTKKIIYTDIDWQQKQKKKYSSYYTPLSLGQMEWPLTKKFD